MTQGQLSSVNVPCAIVSGLLVNGPVHCTAVACVPCQCQCPSNLPVNGPVVCVPYQCPSHLPVKVPVDSVPVNALHDLDIDNQQEMLHQQELQAVSSTSVQCNEEKFSQV